MIKIFQKTRQYLATCRQSLSISREVWRGATLGLLVITGFIIGLAALYRIFLPNPGLGVTLAVLKMVGVIILFGCGMMLVIRLLCRLPMFYGMVLACLTIYLQFGFAGNFPWEGKLYVVAGLVLPASIMGACLVAVRQRANTSGGRRRRAAFGFGFGLSAVALIYIITWFFGEGSTVELPPNAALKANVDFPMIDLPDPSQPGSFAVERLNYGSGEDRKRPEFGKNADIITQPVDGSAFIDGWDKRTGWARTTYWGFGPKTFPLQGRVWYPDGDTPFPLVLIVHGNHSMEEFSDPGYTYLCELLASRGYIAVSVDQNFLNSSYSTRLDDIDGRDWRSELDARGWMLLEHLRVWREWNSDPGSPFYGKVDLDKIGLIGHSRGGEAVAIAAMFNRLPYYPDDAMVKFSYNFNIRGAVAIAPVDRYKPAGLWTTVRDVDYFVLHGSHDADVQSFRGSRQFERVEFSPDAYHFKSSLYIYGANHGQFNSVWGNTDQSLPPRKNLLNTRQLMSGEAQAKIGKVYISAFLEASLRGVEGYLPLFRDFRAGADWLPDTIYLTHFEDSNYQYVLTCDEDLDVVTTTLEGGSIRADNLTVWREQRVSLKQGDKATNAVYLGWDNDRESGTASYTITYPYDALSLTPQHRLLFTLADANEEANPHDDDENVEPQKNEREKPKAIDLTVELADALGQTSRLALSRYAMVQPQMKVQVRKHDMFSRTKKSEPVYQSFEYPLARFTELNPNLNIASLTTIRLIFDRSSHGVLILDNVGFANGAE